MATTTTNFGWDIPQSTDLVKDGATAIAALGQDIDTAFVDLKGGTTGQVLAKASNTDLDYSWVAQDDSNAIQNTQLTAKGALISAFSSATPATLTVGSNGQVLTADSTTATGLAWAAPAGGGKVLQVVQATSTTSTATNSTTYADSTLTATITPSSATSKVLVMTFQNFVLSRSSVSDANCRINLMRGATEILARPAPTLEFNNESYMATADNIVYLDSPATTSATTYKTQQKSGSTSHTITTQPSSQTSVIVLMEIGA
jgi:hypothetical protein